MTVTTISLTTTSPTTLKADAVVVGVARRNPGKTSASDSPAPVLAAGAEAVDEALDGTLLDALTSLGATGAREELTKLPTLGRIKAPLVVAVGLGDAPSEEGGPYDAEALRRAAGAVARSLAGSAKVVAVLPLADADSVAAVAEGALLGAYTFDAYRTSGDAKAKLPVAEIALAGFAGRKADGKRALDRAAAVGQMVAFARELINTPPSDLHPKEFAERAVKTVEALDGVPGAVAVEVVEEKQLRKGGFGGILGVGQGSANPPRLVRVAYTHPKASKTLAYVGKGITFDSGGISLKPNEGMVEMKSDMSGAAAVIGAIVAIAKLGLQVNVTAWAPLAENMPSGSAIRPSDVLRIYGGKTVEVLNTDAEGRLVLADAIVRAGEEKPDAIVDVATLTGAQAVALARTAAIMSNDDAWRTAIHEASRRAGEDMWPMPLPADLRPQLDSMIADIANVGERYGGMLTAGLFLQEFVPEATPWAHLDIAGGAFNAKAPFGYTPKGGTGLAVRTLVQLAADVADGTVAL
jgi:leucyl aminopeptidase